MGNMNFAKFIYIVIIIFISLNTKQIFAKSENLDELDLRKSRRSSNTFYPGQDFAPFHFFQPMTLCYTDITYGTEVWKITNNPVQGSWHGASAQEEYGYPTVWSADGKRYFFTMDYESSAFSRDGGGSWLYYLAHADGTKLRIAHDGPTRSDSHRYGLNWSTILPDVFYQVGRNHYDEEYNGISQRYVYKSTVSDSTIYNEEWVDLGSADDRNIDKSISPDGRTAVVFNWHRNQPITTITIYPDNLRGVNSSWDLDASQRQWSTHWGEADLSSQRFHNAHLVGNYVLGYWLYGNRSSSAHSWWRMRLSGSGSDGGPQHNDDISAPYVWWPNGEIQPANTMYADNSDPWCDDGDPATVCGEYWSHPNFYRDGQLCLFSNCEAPGGCSPAVYDSHNRKWIHRWWNGDPSTQHNNWNGFTDWISAWTGTSDHMVRTAKINDAGSIKVVCDNHEEGSGDDDGCNQSPDGTKLMWGSSFLNDGIGEDYNDVFWAVAYYPYPPEITNCSSSGGLVTIRFDWRLDQASPRSYTSRGWPDPDSDNPPPPRETQKFRLWRSEDKLNWIPFGEIPASIFTKFDFPTGNAWNPGQSSYWEITDIPDDGTYYYAVTSIEWSELESHTLSNIYKIAILGGSGTGSEDSAYPVDPGGTSNFYISFSNNHQNLIRYYNIYANDGSTPPVNQSNRIASISANAYSDDRCSRVDWLGNTNGSTSYVVTAVDYQGNESSANFVTNQSFSHQMFPATAAGQYTIQWDNMRETIIQKTLIAPKGADLEHVN